MSDRHRHPLTVGQLAELVGVTVRTLHHYDQIGLLSPSGRSGAGYRLYTDADVTRLGHVVVYRRLGFSLEEIAAVLDDPEADVREHLRRQRAAVEARIDDMRALVSAIDRALEAEMSGIRLTVEEQRELFGDGFSEEQLEEARERWGDTDAWKQSQARTSRYEKRDWEQIKAEAGDISRRFADALQRGLPADSAEATALAEEHRAHIHTWFYDCPVAMHRNLAEMYVADPRFSKTYDDLAPGLARYIRDAIVASAERHAQQG